METVSKVRRWVRIDKMSQREVARRTGLSRNTIAKYLDDDRKPEYRRKKAVKRHKLIDYEVMLRELYEADLLLPRRERRTVKRLFEKIVQQGFEGSYSAVCRYIKEIRPSGKGSTDAYIPLAFDPGDAVQFDWSQEIVCLASRDVKLRVAHFRLCHSRKCFVVAYLRETQEMLLDGFNRALVFYGGVPRRVIIDNPKTMVIQIGKGRERTYHPRFAELLNHYVIMPEACNPAAGWEKGQVENQVSFIRRNMFTPKLRFASLEELNQHLEARCEALAKRPHPEQKDMSVNAVFAEEQEHLRPLGQAFDGYVETLVRISSTCLARYETNQYSVPSEYAGQKLSLRAYADRIVLSNGANVVATHKRSFGRHQMMFDPWHYLPLLQRKPGALRNGAPFRDWDLPAPLAMIREHYQKQCGGERDFVELLTLYQTHGHDVVEMACALAAEYKTFQLPVIISLIHDLTEDTRPAAMATGVNSYPQLRLPPEANCARYDQLMTSQEAPA